jgi:hypothetical protein
MLVARAIRIAVRMKDGGCYYGRWSGYVGMKENWGSSTEQRNFPEPNEVLFASYGGVSYEGNAIVIFVKDGKLYENQDGHCSCNGLVCWKPEETSLKALAMRDKSTFLGDHDQEARDAYWILVETMLFAETFDTGQMVEVGC